MRNARDLLYWEESVQELMIIVDRVALKAQLEPRLVVSSSDDDYMQFNNNVAFYNRGIMKMREALLKELAPKEEEADE